MVPDDEARGAPMAVQPPNLEHLVQTLPCRKDPERRTGPTECTGSHDVGEPGRHPAATPGTPEDVKLPSWRDGSGNQDDGLGSG
jgi:hypothetical protein